MDVSNTNILPKRREVFVKNKCDCKDATKLFKASVKKISYI
jgi:hypothetical protein